MLRHIVLDNFIHFQGHQTFHFKPGCNLFIGENGSGKTSVFEAVRRCTGLSRNASFSSPHCRNKISATSCIFTIQNGDSASVKSSASSVKSSASSSASSVKSNASSSVPSVKSSASLVKSSACNTLFSSLIRLPSNGLSIEDLFVKVAFNSLDNTVGIDLVKERGDTEMVNSEVHVEDENKIKQLIRNCLQSVIENSNTAQSFQVLFDEIEKSLRKSVENFLQDKESSGVTRTKCEELLQAYIDDKTVFTFVRGIGVCQWSLSERVTHEHKFENYQDVQKRAEILRWFFSSIKEGKIDKEEQNKVIHYFSIITDNCGFKFDMNDSTGEIYCLIKSRKRKAGKDDPEEIQKRLSKVPEGIVEAMNSAIILGVACFRSVFLEEPERGMHPQMIVRMRDLLLRKMDKDQKTVVLSSHHPSFLASWTIPRLIIFKKSETEDGLAFRVIHGDQISTFRSDRKLSRVITSDRFSSLLYANRIFFVEGDSDEFLLNELRLLLIDADDDEILQILQPPPTGIAATAATELHTVIDPMKFRAFMSSIQILNMSGETYKERMFKLCKELEIDTMFLHDYDVIQSKEVSKVNQFLKSFNLQEKYPKEKDILRNVSVLEDDGFFVWNGCKLETVVNKLAERHPSLGKCLKDNNCGRVAKYSPVKRSKSRDKLFLDENVTGENITNVVGEIVACCKKDSGQNYPTEMLRLIQFLRKSSMK